MGLKRKIIKSHFVQIYFNKNILEYGGSIEPVLLDKAKFPRLKFEINLGASFIQ